MAKNKLVKNITTYELAVIINKGFQGQMDYMEKKFEVIDKNFIQVATKEELQKTKKEILGDVGKRFDSVDEKLKMVNKLETRVDYIENVLAIKKN